MLLKQTFTVNCIYGFLFGAGFVLFPAFCSSLAGFEVAGDAPLIARVLGFFVFSSGLLTFLARNAGESEARRAIVLTLFVLYLLLLLYKLALNSVFGIPLTVLLGMAYVLHVGFVASYGYVLFGQGRDQPATPSEEASR